MKYALSFFAHSKIQWVPISLEEILRIAGIVNLSKSKGIFTVKNLDAKGKHCDDLLLVGLERTNKDIFIHFYPVEVKIGVNNSRVIKDAKKQINQTFSLIKEQLIRKKDDNGNYLFKNKFFRNFFIKLFLANAQKFEINSLWPEKNYEIINNVKANLLNDNYKIGNHLYEYIGKGAILSFKKDVYWRSAKKEEDIIILELTEENGYKGVIQSIEELKNKIHNGNTDIKTSFLLNNNYK